MTSRFTTVIALVTMFCSTMATAPAATALDLRSRVDPLAKPLIDNNQVVGMVVGIVRKGESQVIAYGETAKGSGIHPDSDTVYEIGSVTKLFTGVMLADIVLAGKMKPKDPAQKYLPDNVHMPAGGDRPITLTDLVTHTSGLPKIPDNIEQYDLTNPYVDYDARKLYRFLNGHKLRRPPGEYEYSNVGMGLLGHLIALRSGTSYEEVLINRICSPLKMNDTRITLNADQRRRMAPPYNAALEPVHTWEFDALAGCGAIRSTCRDMVKFIEANLANDNRPITKTLRLSHQKLREVGDGQSIGLAWHIHQDGLTRWHNGSTGGYSSWISVIPSHKVGVVVLANTASEQVTPLGLQLTVVALGGNVDTERAPRKRDDEPTQLESYAGVYEIVPQFRLTVTVEDGTLMVQATDQPKFAVFRERGSRHRFVYKAIDAQITFVEGRRGKISHLILHQKGIVDQLGKRK